MKYIIVGKEENPLRFEVEAIDKYQAERMFAERIGLKKFPWKRYYLFVVEGDNIRQLYKNIFEK